MTERQLLTAFTKEVKRVPGLFWYKIPDTRGGQKKPFDVFAIYKGRPICIEFKRENSAKDLEKHQKENLIKVKEAQGIALEAAFYKTKENPRTLRNVYLYPFPFLGNHMCQHIIEYREPGSKEKYPRLEEFFNWAIQL